MPKELVTKSDAAIKILTEVGGIALDGYARAEALLVALIEKGVLDRKQVDAQTERIRDALVEKLQSRKMFDQKPAKP